MNRLKICLVIGLFSLGTVAQLSANAAAGASMEMVMPGNQATGIIEIEDMWGIWVEANDAASNAMERIRVLDGQGTIVYLDRNANASQEWVSYQSWAPGTYQIQIDMEFGFDIHFFEVD